MNNEWLQNLKVGDKVIVFGHGVEELGEVFRFTKTQIHVKLGGYEQAFRKEQGNSYSRFVSDRKYLRQATPEALVKFEEERYRAVFRNKLDHLSWADVPLDTIKQVRELVEPYVKRKENK